MISTGTRIDRGVAESAKNALVVIEHAQGQPVPGAVTETAFGSEAGDRRDIPISLAIHVALVGHRTRYEEAFPQVILPFQLHSVKRRFPQVHQYRANRPSIHDDTVRLPAAEVGERSLKAICLIAHAQVQGRDFFRLQPGGSMQTRMIQRRLVNTGGAESSAIKGLDAEMGGGIPDLSPLGTTLTAVPSILFTWNPPTSFTESAS